MTRKVIGIVLMLFCAGMVWGQTLTKEQEQQFLYYYYEANRLILLQETEKARPIVEFCYLLNPNDANINNYLGYYAKEDGNIPEMIAYFKKAYELAPSDYWYNYNVLLLQTEIKDKQLEAINNLKAVAKANKRDEDVHAVLQKAYISLNLLPEALKVQDALDSIHGYNEQSAIQRYRLNTMMGKNKQAIQEIERYLKEEPENYQFHVFRLQLYEQTKQPADKLIEAYESVLRFDNRNMMWLNNLAWNICISGGDLNKAEELSRTTIMAEPSNSIFLDTYAWILYKKGDYEGAWFYIQRAKEHTTEETDKEIDKHWKAIKRKL
jgi:predicted Zn-dependent protease